MEDQISDHEIRVYEAVKRSPVWMTAIEIAEASGVARRTARHHCTMLSKVGVFDCAKVFSGYRYRIRTELPGEAVAYIARLEAAKRILRVE